MAQRVWCELLVGQKQIHVHVSNSPIQEVTFKQFMNNELSSGLPNTLTKLTLDQVHSTAQFAHDATLVKLNASNQQYTMAAELIATSDSTVPLSQELRASTLLPLQCRACASTIVNANEGWKCLPMPSENWVALAELWVCHPLPADHPQSNSPFGVPIRQIEPKNDQLLVGTDYFLLPMKIDGIEVKVEDEKCLCANCGEVVGEIEEGSDEKRSFKLYKYALRMEARDVLENVYSVESCIAERLVHSQSSLNKCRFIISSGGSECVRITLFNWQLLVWNSEGSTWRSVIKVFYEIVTDDRDESRLGKWIRLELSTNALQSLISLLEENHVALPLQLRFVGKKKVSFLRRIQI
jgi:hypothetical protein